MAAGLTKQTPFGIFGRVLRQEVDAGTQSWKNCKGAQIWAYDMTEGTINTTITENVTYIYTNTSGQYIINVADITTNYRDLDKVRIYCKFGNIVTYQDITLHIRRGFEEVNFVLTRKSRLLDGLTDTLGDRGKYGWYSFGRGLKKGLKDAMI